MNNHVVTIKLTSGDTLKRDYSDFYVQDGILTVYRDEKIKVDYTTYFPYKLHIPLANMIYIEEVRK